jgi:predicted AlkP superfamily pyrophosphatase or phosphodiesterase
MRLLYPFLFFSVSLLSAAQLLAADSTANPARPKLVVGIVIDQFRYDYLTRFRSEYHGGLDKMMREGADFTNAFYQQVPTVTAVGHSIFFSGAMPAMSGIVSNTWYDRDEHQIVTSVCDWEEKTVGGAQVQKGTKCTDSDPASPRRLLASTLGDELRDAHPDSKVIGISIKARGAIMPSGHRANVAYWFDDSNGNFVTSSYYVKELPEYAQRFNQKKLADAYLEQKWEKFPKRDFHASGSAEKYSKIPASPWGNELIERFAAQVLQSEQLGLHKSPDLLTVSFSSNDYIGHAVGPDAPEVHDMALRTDALLEDFFQAIDKQVGLKNTIIVLSADHGVAPLAERQVEEKSVGGRIFADPEDTIRAALRTKFGDADWLIPDAGETSFYLNWPAIDKFRSGKSIGDHEIYETAKAALLATPQLHVSRVYSREQLENGVAGDLVARAEMNGFYPHRSGDLMVVYEPFFVPGTSGTTHFSPWSYDTHVPVLILGPGIKAGRFSNTVAPNDIAPTLATILDVQIPSGSSGRVLTEALQ